MAHSGEAPKELFSECEKKTRSVTTEAYKQLLDLFVQELTFHDPVFISEAHLDAPPAATDSLNLKLERLNYYAWRYRILAQLLTNAKNSETRWFCLALWLKQEKICQPRDFLPVGTYHELTSATRKRLKGISVSDLRYSNLVEIWKPYFERLMADFRRIETKNRNPKSILIKSGYDEKAIDTIMDKKRRNVIPAVCEWLALRGFGDAQTIRNARSRMSSLIKRHKIGDNNL